MTEKKEWDVIVGKVKEIVGKIRTPYYDVCDFKLDNNIFVHCNFIPHKIKVGDKVRFEGEVKDGVFCAYWYKWLNPQTKLKDFLSSEETI